jgi:hypothetical protein
VPIVRILVVALTGGLSVWLAFKYGLVLVAKEYLHWAFLTLRPLVLPVVKVFALKRTSQPFSRIAVKGVIVLIGPGLWRIITMRAKAVGGAFGAGVAWWKAQALWVRTLIGFAIIGGAMFFGFGLFVLPFWLPILMPLFKKVHFFWMDKVLLGRLRPVILRIRRTMRTNPVLRTLRRPHRWLLYWMIVGVRRSSRSTRGWFISRAQRRASPMAAGEPQGRSDAGTGGAPANVS